MTPSGLVVAVGVGGAPGLLAERDGGALPRPVATGGGPFDPGMLGGRVPDELVVVHPTHWRPAEVRAGTAGLSGLAPLLTLRPRCVALAREADARAMHPPGPVAVLERHGSGVAVSVLAAPEGPVLAGHGAASTRAAGPPGDADAAGPLGGADAGSCRDAAAGSCRDDDAGSGGEPDAVRLLAGAARAAGLDPVGLTGGVLLAGIEDAAVLDELTDLTGQRPVVLADPDRLAVLGALRPPRPAPPTGEVPPGPALAPAPPVDLLDAPAARTGRGRSLTGLLAAAGLAVAVLLVLSGTGRPAADARGIGGARQLAQYDYALRLPEGWRHAGGVPGLRRTLLTPDAAPQGAELISVEQTPLGYDSGAEHDRAVRELTDRYQRSRAGGALLDGLTPSERVAGRDVLAYRQRRPDGDVEVDWYVLFERDAQLSVGCQHTARGAGRVRAACEQVLASVHLTP
jgi:type VII secretion-associated protein (TIGR03931 family)